MLEKQLLAKGGSYYMETKSKKLSIIQEKTSSSSIPSFSIFETAGSNQRGAVYKK